MSQTTTTPFKDRRTGLIIFGVLEILLGCLCALLVPAMFFGQKVQADMIGEPVNYQMIIPGALFYGVMAVAFIGLGVGSIRCRRWAWALMLVLSWSWLVVGVISVVAFAFIMPQLLASQPDAPTIWIGMAIAGAILCVVFLVMPGALVLFYHSRHVRATCEARDPVARWTDACPLPVLAASLWFGVGSFSMLSMPVGFKSVLPFFGVLIGGPVAGLAFVVLGLAWIWLAMGFYRLKSAAWWGALVLIVIFGASTAVTFTRVDMMDLYRQMGYPEKQIELIKQSSFISSEAMAWWTAVSFLLILGYLFWIRKHFRRAA